ncbi:hypothetical protein EDD18DRAFT_1109518 [Armillaria luteobubalina]|uniref:Uncharacterized protein n=1 Tax=Armillaria luteobubalina TaxID=153913 RepID=A0AA39UKL3_9AGAR|nr:hypothetical protein EDD18DRAFT_1109518 [Armillaria luteobubalina]
MMDLRKAPVNPIYLPPYTPNIIKGCIKGYNFFQDTQNVPKTCSEELDAAWAMLAELQVHVSRVEDKEMALLSVSLQNNKTTLDKLDSILTVSQYPSQVSIQDIL